jgi:release factor glutamine methyltransferase
MKAGDDLATVVAGIRASWAPLADKPEETPEGIARALWLAAAGQRVSVPRAHTLDLPDLDPAAADRLQTLLARKGSGVPLAHLTERQAFMGLELFAGPGALIPRRETEILAHAALARLRALAEARGSVVALDICTGSGNLALAYASLEPRARVFASDLSEDAIALARRNQQLTGISADRLEFHAGDLFAPFESDRFLANCDLVSCNPPYISAAKVPEMHREISGFEPKLAFDGGAFGVSILMKLIRSAPRFLKPGSWLCFEVGAGQGPAMVHQVRKLPDYTVVEASADASGEIRALVAQTRG